MTDQRPDPDALLRELKLKEETRTGKLKIFFGYAAGVGKTYAMLEAAHHAKEMGVDVVAGYIEPHVRPETLALLDGLEEVISERTGINTMTAENPASVVALGTGEYVEIMADFERR